MKNLKATYFLSITLRKKINYLQTYLILTLSLFCSTINGQNPLVIDFDNNFPTIINYAPNTSGNCQSGTHVIAPFMDDVCTAGVPHTTIDGSNMMVVDNRGEGDINGNNVLWTQNVADWPQFGDYTVSIDYLHRGTNFANANEDVTLQLQFGEQIVNTFPAFTFDQNVAATMNATIAVNVPAFTEISLHEVSGNLNGDFAIDNISIQFCPDPQGLSVHTGGEAGGCTTDFCYGEDIYLDGSIPYDNHYAYFIGVYQNTIPEQGNYTGYGCEPGWIWERFDGPINLSELLDSHCDFTFEPGYYKVKLAYNDPCVGWVEETEWITVGDSNVAITECSLDSYNIRSNCFLDAEVTIENTGICPSGETAFGVWLSEDPEFDLTDILLYSDLTPSLNSSQSIGLNFEIEIPHEGLNRCKYYILFIPDIWGGGFYETDNVCSRIVKRCNIPIGQVGVVPVGGVEPLGGGLVAPQSDGTGNTVESSTYIVSSVTEADNTIINSRSIVETNIKNYPNPFTGQTTIEFTLEEDVPVTLFVSDVTGKQIAVLFNDEDRTKGTHQVIFDGNNYPAGIYYYTIQAGDYVATQKMTLMK